MSHIRLIRNGRLAELRLDNPDKLNALTSDMMTELDRFLDDIERDATIGAVMLTAEGDRAFCTGADIDDWAKLSPAEFARQRRTADPAVQIPPALCGSGY